MIAYSLHDAAPHLRITLRGTLARTEVEEELASLPENLAGLSSQFVARIAYEDLVHIDDATAEVLYYFVTHLFDANPGLCVFVHGGHSPHPGLREYIEQLARAEQVAFVETPEAAARRIEQFTETMPNSTGGAYD